jgi:hypothetical protein
LALACRSFGVQAQPMVKSDFYAQENECRLVAPVRADLATEGFLTDAKPIKFNEIGRPYLEYTWTDDMRLVGYWLAPKRNADDAAAARLWLGQQGHGDVGVHNSRGAYRGRG